MDKIEYWIPIIVSFLGGGFLGSVLTNYLNYKRSRTQPIGKHVEVKQFFNSKINSLLPTQITLTGTTREYKFDNLYILTIELINTGENDYNEFEMGFTLSSDLVAIDIKEKTPDRHHVINYSVKPSLENQVSHSDFSLCPFNRPDKYVIDIFVVSSKEEVTEEDVVLSTRNPIKFVNLVNKQYNPLDLIQEVSIGGIKFIISK